MLSMTLREAAERTSRSVTTLRRYIRSGRLHAEKRYGRFGPEYFVSEHDLAEAGLDLAGTQDLAVTATESCDTAELNESGLAPRGVTGIQVAEEAVPRSLFETLQMKHEQLLVQYGMVRAGGLRYMELSGEVETLQGKLEEAQEEKGRLLDRHRQKDGEMRQGRLEIEGLQLELAAAVEKIKALEMLTRNSATNASIEQQFSSVMEQSRRVREMDGDRRQGDSEKDPTAPAAAHHVVRRQDMTTRFRPSQPESDSDH